MQRYQWSEPTAMSLPLGGVRVEVVPDKDAEADPRIPKDVLEALRTYGRASKIKYFTPEEDAQIKALGALRKYNYSEIARAIGRDSGSVTRRAKALGVVSAYDGVPPPRAITPGQG